MSHRTAVGYARVDQSLEVVRDMQQKFRDYYNNMLQAEIDSKKTKNIFNKWILFEYENLSLIHI